MVRTNKAPTDGECRRKTASVRDLPQSSQSPTLLLVPGGRWQTVADRDQYPEFVGQDFQFALPQAQTHAIAAATIGGR